MGSFFFNSFLIGFCFWGEKIVYSKPKIFFSFRYIINSPNRVEACIKSKWLTQIVCFLFWNQNKPPPWNSTTMILVLLSSFCRAVQLGLITTVSSLVPVSSKSHTSWSSWVTFNDLSCGDANATLSGRKSGCLRTGMVDCILILLPSSGPHDFSLNVEGETCNL